MVYARRDDDGNIYSVSRDRDDNHQEEMETNHPDLIQFLFSLGSAITNDQSKFVESDLKLIRVVEDLINLLIEKHVITFTELPIAAQEKILERQNLRDKLSGLISDDDDNIEL